MESLVFAILSVASSIRQRVRYSMPAWMVEAFAVATADPEIPDDQSSAEVERTLRRKPGTLEQFIKDNRGAFQA